jgi:hypothetical protein
MTVQTFIITTVPNPAGPGAIYQVDGINRPILNLVRGGVYTFNQSAASNTNHPIAFKDGTGAFYTAGVVSTGVPGQAGARTVLTVAANAPDSLRYYCVTHGDNMGNTIAVTGTALGIQTINIGNVVNDGLGDDLRTAFEKVNANFAELDASLTVTASNLGSTGAGIFAGKIGADLQFKNLVSGTKILLDPRVDGIIINSTQPEAFTSITTNAGVVSANTTTDVTIQGVGDIQITGSGSVISVDTVLDLNQILLSFDFGPFKLGYDHPIQLALAAANIEFGTILSPGSLNFDLGEI